MFKIAKISETRFTKNKLVIPISKRYQETFDKKERGGKN